MRPDDTLGYRLKQPMRDVSNAFANVLQATCDMLGKPYVLTPPQYFALGLIANEGQLPIGTLARRLAVDASVATGIIKRLEQQGLVERIHDRTDYRLVRLHLTAEGADITQALAAAVTAFNQRLLQGFSPEEHAFFLQQLARIGANVRSAREESSPLDAASDLVPGSGLSSSEQSMGA